MTTPNPLLAIAASTLLASLAMTPSALADEPGSPSGTSAAPAAETPAEEAAPAAEAPAGESDAAELPAREPSAAEASALEGSTVAAPMEAPAGLGVVAPAPLAPTRVPTTTLPARIEEDGPRHPSLGIAGIVAMVLGGGAIATGVGLVASDEDAGAPTAGVGATVLLSGIVMTAMGYSSESTEERDEAAKRARRVAPPLDASSWEAKQASRETRRNVGIGLTLPGLALGAGGAALIANGVASNGGGGFMSFDFDGLGHTVLGGTMVGVGTVLLAVGVPLWIANSGEEPRPPAVRAELGVGPGSFELRGSF